MTVRSRQLAHPLISEFPYFRIRIVRPDILEPLAVGELSGCVFADHAVRTGFGDPIDQRLIGQPLNRRLTDVTVRIFACDLGKNSLIGQFFHSGGADLRVRRLLRGRRKLFRMIELFDLLQRKKLLLPIQAVLHIQRFKHRRFLPFSIVSAMLRPSILQYDRTQMQEDFNKKRLALLFILRRTNTRFTDAP